MCYPRVGISIVQILERLGHSVDYPEELTRCGQPAFNSGYWDEARPIAARVLNRLKDAEALVIASGSCGPMIKKFYPELLAKTAHSQIATALETGAEYIVSNDASCNMHMQGLADRRRQQLRTIHHTEVLNTR